jgi:Fe-S oxidoreductase
VPEEVPGAASPTRAGEPLTAAPPLPREGPVNLPDYVTHEVLWECTTCRACQEICPATIEHVNKILEMRRNLLLMRGEFPGQDVRLAMENYELNSNPFGTSYASRGEWAAGLDVVDLAESPGEPVDLLYFVGCFAAFDRRNQQVARSLVRLCRAAGLRLGILGMGEKCCGDPPRKLGNEYLYQMMATENIELMHTSGAPGVVTTCPHCYNTLDRDYRDLGFQLPVEHYVTLIARLTGEQALSFAPVAFTGTYHDSCYLSRYRDLTRQPRQLFAAAGGKLVEMTNREKETFCCGGGGGMILSEERLGRRISVTRVGMAQEVLAAQADGKLPAGEPAMESSPDAGTVPLPQHPTGPPVLVSSCPYCLTNFEDGVKVAGAEGELRVRDLAEILAERLACQI